MPDETLVVELSLVAVPLPTGMEEAYWDAIQALAELIEEMLRDERSPGREDCARKQMWA